MKNVLDKPQTVNLEGYGLKNCRIHWNLSGEALQEITVRKGMGTETENGTLSVNTGTFTGRSPQDRFLVKDDYTRDKVWWGNINKPLSSENFGQLYDKVTEYLSGKEVYVHDGYVCSHPDYRMNVRTIAEYPMVCFLCKKHVPSSRAGRSCRFF